MAFPLLAKDLTERAARPRTYVLRAVFGLILVGWFWWSMRSSQPSQTTDPTAAGFALMGAGRTIFASLATGLCAALLVLQPALMAAALTQEKERGTLALLLLTPQRPWKLLLEKYLAGLLPMATLLLFGLPLAAVAYAYGGVSPSTLAETGMILLGTWLQTGAAALLCSAWFRTTPAAIIASYLLLGSFYFVTSQELWPSVNNPLLRWSSQPGVIRTFNSSDEYPFHTGEEPTVWLRRHTIFPPWFPNTTFPLSMLRQTSGSGGFSGGIDLFDMPVVEPYAISEPISIPPGQFNLTPAPFRYSPAAVLSSQSFRNSLTLLLPTALFLLLARLVFLRRSDPPPSRIWPRIFTSLDTTFLRLNRFFGSVSFGSRREAGLANDPILWRESTTGVLGRPQHLVRISFGLFLLAALLLFPMMWTHPSPGQIADFAGQMIRVFLVICALFVVVRAVEAIGGERQRQTLDVLLSAPISRRSILLHKARPLVWLTLALLAPIAVIYSGRMVLSPAPTGPDASILRNQSQLVPAAIFWCGLVIAFWEIRWLGLWLGLRIRSRGKATLTALAALLLWTYLPRFVERVFSIDSIVFSRVTEETKSGLHALPLHALTLDSLVVCADRGTISELASASGLRDPSTPNLLLFAALALLFHAGIAFVLRRLTLRYAERHL